MPVSMQGAGRGVSRPLASRSYCMKTRFQISSHRSHSHSTPRHVRPAVSSAHGRALPWKKWISEHGPQGPVSPIAQKFSFAPSSRIRSSLTCAFQNPCASTSRGTPSSPLKIVTFKRSFGRPKSPVSSSQAKAIASFLK